MESAADPTLLRGQQEGDPYWYMYCTSDPLTGAEWTGRPQDFHLIPMFRSADLIEWSYMGDAFSSRPDWVREDAGLWAPEIRYFNGRYYLYYAATDTTLPGGGSAIGVATSTGPLGPWTDQGVAVVEPQPLRGMPDARRWVFDPDVLQDGELYIFYGSYQGGISVRKLSPDGLRSDPATEIAVTIGNRFEAPEVVWRDGFYYLFVSCTDCCNGSLTGYSVFVGRSESPTGPFLDRNGVPLLDPRGGTPVVSMNGNRWVGTGHNSVFEDFDGQWWMVYHGIDRFDPYFPGFPGFTRRPVLLDPIDWIDGWPTVRAGRGASDGPMFAPAARPGQRGLYQVAAYPEETPARLISGLSDEFDDGVLGRQWSWIREPDASAYGEGDGHFRFATQAADLFPAGPRAAVLTERTPAGSYVVETRVKLDLPLDGACFNFIQAGLVIYGSDDDYVKLSHVAIWETRQTEFAKMESSGDGANPRYGRTVVGPPGEWTYLRILKRNRQGEERYTAYTSLDGQEWVRGGTWTHRLGAGARIGLVAMGGRGFTASFDYVRVYELRGRPPT